MLCARVTGRHRDGGVLKALNQLIVRTLPLVPKPIVRRIASRYVAGETLEEALRVVQRLNAEGCMATLDVLGEDVTRREETEQTVTDYLRALTAIAERGLDSNISVKLTALGLKLDAAQCRRQFARIVEAARAHGNFVRIDMEDSSVTEETIRIFLEFRERYEKVGLVLQAYLHRSAADARRVAAAGPVNVRVCKGIYVEPPEIAFQDREQIRRSYMELVESLLAGGAYVGIATHDPPLVERSVAAVRRLALPAHAYEFQMLLGVAGDLRRKLVADGHRLRVYVPYGAAWYAYSVRRLKENPSMAGHVLAGIFRPERKAASKGKS
ncbi:MAG: proline dehydrogenase family protein [Acidobacteriota bacterium]